MSEYPLYALSEEHQAIREAVRAVCDAKVAPHAAEVDEESAFPQASYDALAAADAELIHYLQERSLSGHRYGIGGTDPDACEACDAGFGVDNEVQGAAPEGLRGVGRNMSLPLHECQEVNERKRLPGRNLRLGRVAS